MQDNQPQDIQDKFEFPTCNVWKKIITQYIVQRIMYF